MSTVCVLSFTSRISGVRQNGGVLGLNILLLLEAIFNFEDAGIFLIPKEDGLETPRNGRTELLIL